MGHSSHAQAVRRLDFSVKCIHMKPVRITLTIIVFVAAFLGSISCGARKTEKPDHFLLWREAILRDNLTQIRRTIDQYAADKQALPQTLEDLVSSKYIREVPIDPITGKKDWQSVTGVDPSLSKGSKGIIDIRSTSPAKSSEGMPYNEW